MRLNGIKQFGGAILGLLLFVGIMAVSSTTAQAQYPTWNQDQYRRAERERIERERELQRQRQRQTQQSGYYDQYGNWHSTGSYNNNGYYNNGYNRGRNYDGYGNQGGSYELRQTALNAGYNEGLKAGREDRRRGRYNPSHSINSLKDYNSRMGDRSAYQNYFMQAYQNGYADGYRGV
jgi:type II secretory pathway pseudopilin PulG